MRMRNEQKKHNNASGGTAILVFCFFFLLTCSDSRFFSSSLNSGPLHCGGVFCKRPVNPAVNKTSIKHYPICAGGVENGGYLTPMCSSASHLRKSQNEYLGPPRSKWPKRPTNKIGGSGDWINIVGKPVADWINRCILVYHPSSRWVM
jgi:hypothetical protein